MSKVDAAKCMRHSFGAGTKCVFVVFYNTGVCETHFVLRESNYLASSTRRRYFAFAFASDLANKAFALSGLERANAE